MNGAEFRSLVLAALGKQQSLTVEVLKGIENFSQELVLDPGMRGRVISVSTEDGYDDEVVIYRFRIDLTEFMAYNEPYERENWFVGPGPATDTARNTGNWPKDNVDEIWISAKDRVDEAFKILIGTNKLHDEYLMDSTAMENKETYIMWLERKLTEDRDKLGVVDKMITGLRQRIDRLECCDERDCIDE